MPFTGSFPLDRLNKTADAFRTFDFRVRAQSVAQKIIPEAVSALSSASPTGKHYKYPSTSPIDGGALKKSFYGMTVWTGPTVATIALRSRAKYAGYVLHGTPAHQIPPGNKGYLFFYSQQKGSWIKTTKAVNHPGTKSYDYAITARALIRDAVPKEWSLTMRDFPNA